MCVTVYMYVCDCVYVCVWLCLCMCVIPRHALAQGRLSHMTDKHLENVGRELVHLGELCHQSLTFVLLTVGAEEGQDVVDLMMLFRLVHNGGARLVHLEDSLK